MMDSHLTNCKLFVGDIEENDFLQPVSLITVSRMDYSLFRTRDEGGRPFGHAFATMTLVINLGARTNARAFFERMRDNDPHRYTIFSDLREKAGKVEDYTSAMVVGGLIVGAEESYSVDSRTILRIEIEIRDIKYLGKNETRKLMVFHG